MLIGPPGSGKSTVGKALASEMNLNFIDTDSAIELKAGKKISEIFLDEGEAGFRKIERQIVLESLEVDSAVIALGGGSVLDKDVQSRLKVEPNVIYLEVSISNAAPRVGFNTERPLLLANPRQQWLKLFEERKAIYESLGRIKFSTDNKKPKESANAIKELVQ